jgi:hypothetical protein
MLHGFQKEQKLQTHIIEKMLDELPYGDSASARALAEHAIRHAYDDLFSNRFGSISGIAFCVVYSNMGPDNDWLRKRFRDHISEDYLVHAEVGINFDDESDEVKHMPELDEGPRPYTFLFLVEGDGYDLEEMLRELWIQGLR